MGRYIHYAQGERLEFKCKDL